MKIVYSVFDGRYKKFMESFIQTYNVSRETFEKLEQYVALLKTWQTRLNLVSAKSLEDVWQRHIADSAQLFEYLDTDDGVVYDLGSGAGFPALVLALMAKDKKPDLRFKLIESTTKKTVYLNAVIEALGLKNTQVLNDRIENLKLPPADYITSRALAALPKLLAYALPLTTRQTKLILPKGKSYREELDNAAKEWNFKRIIKQNKVSDEGVILLLENLRRKSK